MYTQANVERDVQATANAKDSLAWGTKIVGGVIPGRTGEHLGLPVLPSVRQVTKCDRQPALYVLVKPFIQF